MASERVIERLESPQLEETITLGENPSVVSETPFAPEGWLTKHGIAQLLRRSDTGIERVLEPYKETNPEWFQVFKSTANTDHRERLFHAPELIEKLSNELGSREIAPEGWVSATTLPKLLGKDRTTIDRMAEQYRQSNPEWFRLITTTETNGRRTEHYSPEAIDAIRSEILPEAPEGWFTLGALSTVVGRDWRAVKRKVTPYRETHPEHFQKFSAKGTLTTEYISPELANEIASQYNIEYPEPGEGWMTRNQLAKVLPRTRPTISKALDQYRESNPEWFQTCHIPGKGNVTAEYFAPELIDVVSNNLRASKPALEGWISVRALSSSLGTGEPYIKGIAGQYRESNPEWFKIFVGKRNHTYEHLSPELVMIIGELAKTQAEAPEGWFTYRELSNQLGANEATLRKRALDFLEDNSHWVKTYFTRTEGKGKRLAEYIHPDLAQILRDQYSDFSALPPDQWVSFSDLKEKLGLSDGPLRAFIKEASQDKPEWVGKYKVTKKNPKLSIFLHPQLAELATGHFSQFQKAPEGWTACNTLARKIFHVARETLIDIALPYSESHPEWFGLYKSDRGQLSLHYSPELVAAIKSNLMAYREERSSLKSVEHERLALESDVETFISNIGEGDSLESQEFQALLQMFGSERAVDILFQYRPEYQKVSLPFAKRVIGDYLGEFLVVKGDLQLDKLEMGVQYLSDPNLKEGLREVIKGDFLMSYNQLRREDLIDDDLSALQNYIAKLRNETEGYSTPELAEVLDEVEEYYKALFEVIQIPDNVVEELEPGRLFPDINQRINILELMGKQKMLIADEMGVGKSASAILAKESLGVKQALVIVPSNVIEVWQKYLSDHKNSDGSAKGYFKDGQIPHVLTVNNGLNDLKDEDLSMYDYIIISQERLTAEYMQVLEQVDYDMLIVDEAHKLKNITSGKRAENLIKLAEKIEGDDKYLALLSGTPVPNHVSDVAMVLRLLYPEKFEGVANKELTRQILDGDILDLRSLLVPRMQMKTLAESIEMPKLHEELHIISMSDQERDIYEVLLEEDELTATDKLRILRQFILNSQAFEMTPGLESSKIRTVGETLNTTFSTKNKVVMFVNGYVDGVIRGENTIFEGLNLPEDVEVHVIDGKVPKARRLEIQKMLQEQSDRKMLLAVSGQTADVGVDFSGAEELFFYNEPWTEYDKQQQQGRVYRPGLMQDLVSHTFYIESSVEEGIHKYIEYKYNAVEKLLRGIPLSELERNLLKEDEKQVDPNLEVNPALAEHYLSSWHRMLKIYNHVKEIGEPNFRKFLDKYAREYAECYTELGSRSYQANANRLAGTVINSLAKSKNQPVEYARILDVASGPEMLKRHISEEYQDHVVSVDINSHHFEQADEKHRVGSFLDLPIADSTVDYANLALALHYTKFLPSKGIYERIKVFQELNRVLVNEGVAVINLMHNHDLKDNELFVQSIEKVGFKVIEGLSGEVSSADNFKSRMFVLQKVSSCTQDTNALVQQIGYPLIQGFKFAKTDVKLKDSRKIVTNFIVGARKIRAKLNQIDQNVLDEEMATLSRMKSLRRKYGSIQNIPSQIIYQSGLTRAFTGKTYVLFKSLETGNGAVIIR